MPYLVLERYLFPGGETGEGIIEQRPLFQIKRSISESKNLCTSRPTPLGTWKMAIWREPSSQIFITKRGVRKVIAHSWRASSCYG